VGRGNGGEGFWPVVVCASLLSSSVCVVHWRRAAAAIVSLAWCPVSWQSRRVTNRSALPCVIICVQQRMFTRLHPFRCVCASVSGRRCRLLFAGVCAVRVQGAALQEAAPQATSQPLHGRLGCCFFFCCGCPPVSDASENTTCVAPLSSRVCSNLLLLHGASKRGDVNGSGGSVVQSVFPSQLHSVSQLCAGACAFVRRSQRAAGRRSNNSTQQCSSVGALGCCVLCVLWVSVRGYASW
jgi:hypothetical protein